MAAKPTYEELERRVAELEAMKPDQTKIEISLDEERFRLIAENSIENIFQLDNNGRVIYTSQAVKKIFGYNIQEALGLRYDQFLVEFEAEGAEQSFIEAISGKEFEMLEFTGKRKDGSTIPVEVSLMPIYQNGSIEGLIGIVRDISERRRMDQELRAERDFIEQIMETSPAGITRVNAGIIQMRTFRELFLQPGSRFD